MNVISPSIWQQDKKGEWKLYFNCGTETNKETSNTKSKEKNLDSIKNLNNKFVLGTLVMTPKGMGRLQKIQNEICSIKMKDGKEESFQIQEINNDITFLIYYNIYGVNIIRLKLRTTGKVEDIFDELEKTHIINRKQDQYSIIFKGNLLKNGFTFEQLELLNNSKLLLLKESKDIVYKVKRFQKINQFWLASSGDGIGFSPSEKIKLVGLGVFCSHDNKTHIGNLAIYKGSSLDNDLLYEQRLEIPSSSSNEFAIFPIYFTRPILCEKDSDYGVYINYTNVINTYYGSLGKSIVEGEKGVNFTFKKLTDKIVVSKPEMGNFPEFYYSIH